MIDYVEGKWIEPPVKDVVEHEHIERDLRRRRQIVEKEVMDRCRSAETMLHAAIKMAMNLTRERLKQGKAEPSESELVTYVEIQKKAEYAIQVEEESSKLLEEAWRLIVEHNKKRPVAVLRQP